MAAQKGLAVLVKVSSDGTNLGTMNTLGGMRSPGITINAETVDVTTADSTNRMRELLAGAGIVSCSISGSGVFDDDAAIEDLRGHIMGSTHSYLQFIIPDYGTIAGEFQVTTFEIGGDHNTEVTFSISAESAGEFTFTAA